MAMKRFASLLALLLVSVVLAPPVPCSAKIPPAGAQALVNGGYEQATAPPHGERLAAGWEPYGAGYALNTSEHHGGQTSISCQSATGNDTHGADQLVTLDQNSPAPVEISGWSRAEEVAGAADADYAVYADLTYTDGSPLWAQVAPFATGTHGWQ